jgi:hypothetical protein
MRPTGDTWEIDLWRRSFEDYVCLWQWMRTHFPCLLAQQPPEKLGSQILIELLQPLATREDSCEQEPQQRQWIEKNALAELQPALTQATYY